jgi:CheY-like chemotaxis protein
VSDKKTVLFVDDELPMLQLVGELMSARSGGTWNVLMAETGAKALAMLKEHSVDLLVVDARMPVMNGLQLVRLVRPKYPHVPAVLMTGYLEEQNDGAYMREGVDVLLEKPQSSEGYETLFLTLSQVLDLHRHHGFRGLLDHVELQDVIQLECLRRNSSVLNVFTSSESAEIVIRNGVIIHAAVGELVGEAAFNHALALKGGEFRLKPYCEPATMTIQRNWEVLLMEAARMRDEQAGLEQQAGESEAELSAHASFPVVQLTEAEQAHGRPTRAFAALSSDGDVLFSVGMTDTRTSALARLARELVLWPVSLNIGRPESFEATTMQSEIAVQFQPEAVAWAVRDRRQ